MGWGLRGRGPIVSGRDFPAEYWRAGLGRHLSASPRCSFASIPALGSASHPLLLNKVSLLPPWGNMFSPFLSLHSLLRGEGLF